MFLLFACRMGQPKPNKRFCLVLTCMLHDFLEEICVAGGTVLVLFLFCTSPDDASLKGGRVMCEGKFFLACGNQRCFACLISNKFETKRQ